MSSSAERREDAPSRAAGSERYDPTLDIPLTREQTLHALRACSGEQYDPILAGLLGEALKTGRFVALPDRIVQLTHMLRSASV